MKRICIGLLLLFSNQLVAQITFGPKLGIGLSPADYKIAQDFASGDDTYEYPKNRYLVVPMLFGMVDIPISNTFSLRTGIGYRQQCYSYVDGSNYIFDWQAIYITQTDIVTGRLDFFEIPAYVSAKLPFCKRKFELIAGGSIGLNLGGRAHIDRYYTGDSRGFTPPADTSFIADIPVGKTPEFDRASMPETKKYNFSMLIGAGYKVNDRILLNLETTIGLTNLMSHPDNSFRSGFITAKSLSLSATYSFGGNKKIEE